MKNNFIFLLILFATFWWQAFQFLIQQATGDFLIWSLKLQYIFIVFIPVLLNHFLFLVTREKEKKKIHIIHIGYIISIVFSIISITTNKIIDGYYNYFWGIHPKAGDWHPFFILFVVIYINIFIFNLFKKYRTATIFEQKKQYLYFLLAVIFYSISAINFIPNYGIEIYPFGVFTLWFFIGFMFYGIAKYNLISTKAILNYSFVIFSLSIISYVFWLVILYIEYYFIKNIFSEKSLIINMIIMPIFVYIFIEIYKKVKKIAHNIFENFDKKKQVHKFITEIGEKNSSQEAIEYVLNKMPLILKTDVAFIFHRDNNYQLIKGNNFDAKIKSEDLSNFYLRNKGLTRIEELNLKAIFPDSKNSIVRELMNKNDIAILMHLNDSISFLLQQKNDGHIFYQEEIEFLELIKDVVAQQVL